MLSRFWRWLTFCSRLWKRSYEFKMSSDQCSVMCVRHLSSRLRRMVDGCGCRGRMKVRLRHNTHTHTHAYALPHANRSPKKALLNKHKVAYTQTRVCSSTLRTVNAYSSECLSWPSTSSVVHHTQVASLCSLAD